MDERPGSVKISVIVCTYNYARFLGDALRTLAAQSDPNFELLIVDDGSTDHTEEVVRRFSPQFRNCKYLRKPHTGLADSRNFGVRAASGTHLGFLDADDLWAPEYLEAMREVFETMPQAEMVCADGLNIRAGGEVTAPFFPPGLPPVCGPLRSAERFLAFFPYAYISATLFTRSVYERTGAFDTRYRFGEDDIDWFSRAIQQDTFCVRLDRKLAIYRIHGSNLTSHVDKILEGWLSVYAERWKGKVLDPEITAWFRHFTRRWFLPLLALHPAARNRELLRRAMETLEGDRFLEAAYFLTYLGLCRVARPARQIKRVLQHLLSTGRIDLAAPPEIMFAPISEAAARPQAIAAEKAAGA